MYDYVQSQTFSHSIICFTSLWKQILTGRVSEENTKKIEELNKPVGKYRIGKRKPCLFVKASVTAEKYKLRNGIKYKTTRGARRIIVWVHDDHSVLYFNNELVYIIITAAAAATARPMILLILFSY